MKTTYTKIRGLQILINKEELLVKNSYQIKNKEKIQEVLIEALAKESDFKTNRTLKSLTKEWVARNKLYDKKIFKNKNKDCHFKVKLSLFKRILYSMLSIGGQNERRKEN